MVTITMLLQILQKNGMKVYYVKQILIKIWLYVLEQISKPDVHGRLVRVYTNIGNDGKHKVFDFGLKRSLYGSPIGFLWNEGRRSRLHNWLSHVLKLSF